jgi:TatD DNase family protein
MDIKYIDIHGHVHFSDYAGDLDAVIDRAKSSHVAMINIGTDIDSSRSAVELAKKHKDCMWATVGLHPADRPDLTFDEQAFGDLARDDKVVAIGECGLDYFHAKPEDVARQREIFIKQIELANKVNKPLMLHIRNGKKGTIYGPNGEYDSAYKEAVGILRKHAKVKANFHFFTGTESDAQAILDIGGLMSFTGVITFSRDYDSVIKYLPLENIMTETDCPYVAPVPYRGNRNEPVYVIEINKRLAEIRGDGLEAVNKQMLENARRMFNIYL